MNQRHTSGFTLIEVVIVSAIMLLFFGGLFEGVKYSIGLIATSREKLTALTVATEQIEYIRSLSYDSVGTVLGIPSGLIPQTSTTTLNNTEFERRVLVEYVDDAADGIGAADSNGITTDYKQAKVTVSWTSRGVAKELFLVSNIIPRSIETSVGGGTLRVNVFDADVQPFAGASVRLINNTLVPNIDVTRTTDSTGVALFGGAPAGSDYEISVTDTGYSTDQTYAVSVALPNPTTLPVAVLEADISTMNFFIDELSTLTVRTLSGQISSSVTELFADASGIASSTNIAVSGDAAKLQDNLGVFDTSGTFYLATVTPSPLLEWSGVSVAGDAPSNTTATIRFYTGTSTYTLLSDAALPGNGSGFSLGQVDISMIDVATYPSLTVGVVLTTSDTATTSAIDSIEVSYLESESSLSGVSLTAVGAKTIGTDAGGNPVYKHTYLGTTASGEYEFSDIEWDDYGVTASGYDISEACRANPLSVAPGTISTLDLILAADSAYTLRVAVETIAGVPLSGADVTLSRSGFSDTKSTSSCGQVFFSGLTSAIDYQIDINPSGYSNQTLTDVAVENDEVVVVQF